MTKSTVFPSSRRRFLSLVGTSAAVAVIPVSIPAPAKADLQVSPALREAAKALDDVFELLKAARSHADDRKALHEAWKTMNPKPRDRRAEKRWARRRDTHFMDVVYEAYVAQGDAEDAFRQAQKAVADVEVASDDDLQAKACIAVVYDKEMARGQSIAVISYSVAYAVAARGLPKVAS